MPAAGISLLNCCSSLMIKLYQILGNIQRAPFTIHKKKTPQQLEEYIPKVPVTRYYCRTYPIYESETGHVQITGCDVVTAEIFISEPNSNIQVSCIQFLEILDGEYPETYTIRIIDDDCRVFELPEIQLYLGQEERTLRSVWKEKDTGYMKILCLNPEPLCIFWGEF